MKKMIWIMVALMASSCVQARYLVTRQNNYSGVYDCTGEDVKEGHYKGTVTLTLKPEQSTFEYTAYDFKLEAEGFGTYPGEAVANGDKMAIHFALNEPNTKDAGTGIATFKTNPQGKYTFHKYYYESAYKGGNSGFEDCIQR